jgi:hypothetical protein
LDSAAKFGHDLSIDLDAAAGDQFLALPAAAEAGGRKHLLQAVTGRMLADRPGRLTRAAPFPPYVGLSSLTTASARPSSRAAGSTKPSSRTASTARPSAFAPHTPGFAGLATRSVRLESLTYARFGRGQRGRFAIVHANNPAGLLPPSLSQIAGPVGPFCPGGPLGGAGRSLGVEWSSFWAGHSFKWFAAKPLS